MLIGRTMQPIVLFHLRTRRVRIHASWAALLRIEPVSTPLAKPEVLVYQFDLTLDRIFDALRHSSTELCPATFHCSCGLNPYLAYFRAAEQALLETLVLVHAQEAPQSDAGERARDVAHLKTVVRLIGGEEMALFGSICRHREQNEPCGRCSSIVPATPPSPVPAHR